MRAGDCSGQPWIRNTGKSGSDSSLSAAAMIGSDSNEGFALWRVPMPSGSGNE
jgi:hypothetical protein